MLSSFAPGDRTYISSIAIGFFANNAVRELVKVSRGTNTSAPELGHDLAALVRRVECWTPLAEHDAARLVDDPEGLELVQRAVLEYCARANVAPDNALQTLQRDAEGLANSRYDGLGRLLDFLHELQHVTLDVGSGRCFPR